MQLPHVFVGHFSFNSSRTTNWICLWSWRSEERRGSFWSIWSFNWFSHFSGHKKLRKVFDINRGSSGKPSLTWINEPLIYCAVFVQSISLPLFAVVFPTFLSNAPAQPSPFPLLCISWHSQGNRWGLWTGRSSRRRRRRWDFSSTGSLMKGKSEGQLLLLFLLPWWGADTVTQSVHSHSAWSDAKLCLLRNLLFVRIHQVSRYYTDVFLPVRISAPPRLRWCCCWGCSHDSTNRDIKTREYLNRDKTKLLAGGDRNNCHLSGLVVECQPWDR